MRSTVLKTCGRRRTWQMVQTPPRASRHRDAVALARHHFEGVEHALVEAADQRGALDRDPFERRLHLDVRGAAALALGLDRLRLGGELRLGAS